MESGFLTASVVGTVTDTHWSQVLQGRGVGVLEVVAPDGVARSRGMHIMERIGSLVDTSVVSLQGLTDVVDDVVEEGVKTLLVLLPVGDAVYVVLRGRGRVYLKRGENLAVLLDGEGAVSGMVQPGDVLLLLSETVAQMLTTEDTGQVFDHLSVQGIGEKLTIALHKHPEPRGAALVFQVGEGGEHVEEETDEVVTVVASPRTGVSVVVAPFIEKFQNLARAFRERMAERRMGRRSFSLSRDRVGPKQIIVIVLILIFVGSVLLGLARARTGRTSSALTQTTTEAQRIFDEGMALLDLNPVKARERLAVARDMLGPITQTVSSKTKEGREVLALYKQITDNLTGAMQIARVEPTLFFDVGLLKKGAQVTHIALEKDRLAIIDGVGKTLYQLDIAAKNGKIIGGGEDYLGARLVAIHGDKVYTLADSGIHETRTTDNKTVVNVIGKNPQWGQIVEMVAFGGNLYLLDTQKGRIWKYVATANGFSELREYLNPDTLPDLSRGSGMAIDGSVWVGTGDGKIFRFTQGKENTFVSKGVDPALGTDLVVFTSDEANHVYVLDRSGKRVVVLDKDGAYAAQYQWQGDLTPSAFAVSETQKKILLVARGALYSIDLK